MKKMVRKILLILIAIFALVGMRTLFIGVRVEAADNYISLNSDIICEEYGNYWFNVTEPGLLTIRPSDISDKYSRVALHKYDEMTGEESRVSTFNTYYFYSDDTKTFRIGSGLYYLTVYNEGFNPFTCIKLEFQTEMDEAYEKEWNDSFDTAQPIIMNSLYTASTLSHYSNTKLMKDLDYYKFTLENQGSVSIYMKKINDTRFMSEMELYKEDKDGNVALIDTISFDKWESVIKNSIKYRLPAGNYYLKYIPTDGLSFNSQCDYQFKVNYNVEDASGYETESNDTISEANIIKTNIGYTGNLQGIEDVDYFTFNLSNTSTVNLQFNQPRETQSGTYRIDLYKEDSNGTLLSQGIKITDSNPVNYGEKILLKKGKYYVKVSYNAGKNNIHWYDIDSTNYKLSVTDYRLMVKEVPITLVKSIKISSPTSKIYTGDNITLKVSLLPTHAFNKTVKWISTDEEVATVNSKGKVKAISSGECYIVATATDGSGISAKYRLIVNKNKDKNLNSMKSSVGSLTQKFSPNKSNYVLDIGNKNQVTITLKARSKYSTIYIDSKKAVKKKVKLTSETKKNIKIVVVAENGSEKKYNITVSRKK